MPQKNTFVSILIVTLLAIQFNVFAAPPRRPNIIFIITDDQLPHTFNFLPEGRGNNLTPNLDRLANEGTILMGQHVSSSVCTPSRYSCLTGTYASRALAHAKRKYDDVHGIGWNTHIMPDTTTLPKMLRDAGYVTGAVGKNHVIDVPGWPKIGWDADPNDAAVKSELARRAKMVKDAYHRAGFQYAERLYQNNPDGNGIRKLAVHNLDWVTEGALEFIDQNADQPFLLWYATTVPHGPKEAKRSWNADRRVTADGILAKAPNVLPARDTIPKRLAAANLPKAESGKDDRANMLWLDDAVGAMMKRLEDRKIDDNTIIIYFNDHGQAAKGTVYQSGAHNPSVIWRKKRFACGPSSDALISNIDFAPTILDMAGVEIPASGFDGKSFLPLLEGKTDQHHDALFFEIGYTRAILKDGFKYIALRYPKQAVNMSLKERKKVLHNYNARQRKHDKPTSPKIPAHRSAMCRSFPVVAEPNTDRWASTPRTTTPISFTTFEAI